MKECTGVSGKFIGGSIIPLTFSNKLPASKKWWFKAFRMEVLSVTICVSTNNCLGSCVSFLHSKPFATCQNLDGFIYILLSRFQVVVCFQFTDHSHTHISKTFKSHPIICKTSPCCFSRHSISFPYDFCKFLSKPRVLSTLNPEFFRRGMPIAYILECVVEVRKG